MFFSEAIVYSGGCEWEWDVEHNSKRALCGVYGGLMPELVERLTRIANTAVHEKNLIAGEST